jgi:hypothetical protein
MAECLEKSSSQTERGQSEKADKDNDHDTDERTRIAELVGKSGLDPGEFPPSESKEIQMAECIGKSNLESRKFPPLRSGRIPARNEKEGDGKERDKNQDEEEEGEGWDATPRSGYSLGSTPV